jgi:Ca2+-binding RTX toxin-like protein
VPQGISIGPGFINLAPLQPFVIDMDHLPVRLSELLGEEIGTATSTYLNISGPAATFEGYGSGLSYDANAQLQAGQFDRLYFMDANISFTVTQGAISAQTVNRWLQLDDTQTELRELLAGADVITGGAGSDVLRGYGGDDALYGSPAGSPIGFGADTLDGGAGNDVLRAGWTRGATLFIGGAGNDSMEGGDGWDTAAYSGRQTDYSVVVQSDATVKVTDLRAGSPDGQDTLNRVDKLSFSDGAVGLGPQRPFDAINLLAISVLRDPTVTVHSSAIWAQNTAINLSEGVLSTIADVVKSGLNAAAATTSVATMSYQFFTGHAPSAAGMDYLVSGSGPNPNNLNAAYYQSFSMENRYINFAVNLGKAGEGRAQFEAQYGSLNLFDATRKAYEAIFGGAPSDAKVHALLDPVADLGGVTMTRAQYFAYYGQDGADGLGTKAAMVGWLLTEAVKADLGTYAKSNDAFLTDVALHDAAFAVDVVGHYGQAGFAYQPT